MRRRLPVLLVLLPLCFQVGYSQIPAVQLKIKESSGFLGLGGPRVVQFRLSDQDRKLPLNSTNVNAGPYVYFECVPVGDWQFDEGFVKDYLSRVTVEQNDLSLSIAFLGNIVTSGDTTSILLGYPKTLRIEEPFVFRFPLGEVKNEVECRIPEQFWPGYETLTSLWLNAQNALSSGQYRRAIALCREIMDNGAFSIFSKHEESKSTLLRVFGAYLGEQTASMVAVKDSTRMDLKEKILRVKAYRPAFVYVIDSLPQVPFEVPSLDSTVQVLQMQARKAVLLVGSMADSLQNILDEQTVRWILQGSVTGRRGLQYQEMIRALAYAYASLDFADTTASVVPGSIPPQFQSLFVRDSLMESYQTFVRICGERYQMHLTLFPVEFLPNLRKDTAAFSLPYYSMLKAVSDFYGGNRETCRNEIATIFRSCYSGDLLRRFDSLRVILGWREHRAPPDVFALMREGSRLETTGDLKGAEDKYRQAMIIAPDLAYSSWRLGEFYSRTGDSLRAVTAFQKAYMLDTLYLTAYRDCSGVYRRQGNDRSVVDVVTLAIARGNDFWVTNFDLGDAFMRLGDPLSAVARYARALELNPRSYETYIAIGKACQASKDFQKARDYFNRAIEIDALRQEAVDALNKLNEQQLNAR